MFKYTKGKWSWKFIDGNKPCIMIDDGKGDEIGTLQFGDMVLIINAAKMFELLNEFADIYSDASGGILVDKLRDLLRSMNVAR